MAKRSIIFAGGSGGLGAAAARAAAAQGDCPVIGYLRNRERAELLATDLGSVAVGGDILDTAVRKTLIEAALRGKKYDLAQAMLSERIAVRPKSPYNWLKYSKALEGIGQDTKAVLAREKANQLNSLASSL